MLSHSSGCFCPLRPLVVGLITLLMSGTASAHGLGVEAKLQNGRVQLLAFFDDDTPASESTVTVESDDGVRLAEGRTDARGLWHFPRPKPGTYRVTVDVGDGHRTKIQLTIPPEANNSDTSSVAGDESVMTAQGLTRGDTLLTRRGAMTLLGIGLITFLTLFARWVARRRSRSTSSVV